MMQCMACSGTLYFTPKFFKRSTHQKQECYFELFYKISVRAKQGFKQRCTIRNSKRLAFVEYFSRVA